MIKNNEKYKRLIRILMVMTLIAAEMAIYYVVWRRNYNRRMEVPYDVKGNYMIAAVYGIVIMLFAHIYGALRIGYLRRGNLAYSQILTILCSNVMMYLQITLLVKHFYTIVPLLAMTGIEIVLILLWSVGVTYIYRKIYPPRRVCLVYGDRPISSMMTKLHTRTDRFEVCEMIHISEGLEKILQLVKQYEGLVICDVPSSMRNKLLKYCYGESIRTYTVPKISDIIVRSAENLHMFDTPLLLSRNTGLHVEQSIAKRLMDIICSIVALSVFSPIILCTALAIKAYDRGPVLFYQKRCTKDGRVFTIYKFRSMIVDAEKDGHPIPATERDPRITPVGRIIRATRIDELPQFINILKGDMSLVGPRPERIEHVEKYTAAIPEFKYRLKVKGGLTGYAQVYGKYNTTAYDKLKLDLMYIENYSFLLDIEILFKTLKILLLKESTEGFDDTDSQAMLQTDFRAGQEQKEKAENNF
ncbi:sugar transferase [Lacrimispora sp. 210928-DFI.3.58]|uniref:sugar transferase n=1 Tax=Lacrimispora sp. 210928-DFI.3.58 TaxID=2883214 RepID=UPI0015B5E925|nr:sugar transferase [Lacrimispora sp. 210928-DFI.3.58]MCB7320960.1 sugar transferase [Lacrimispora sp. 210928-DFI.3.58]